MKSSKELSRELYQLRLQLTLSQSIQEKNILHEQIEMQRKKIAEAARKEIEQQKENNKRGR